MSYIIKIKVVVQKDNGINDITLYLVKIFNIRFDLDRFIKRIVRKEALEQRIREIEYDLEMASLSTDKPKVYQKTINDK